MSENSHKPVRFAIAHLFTTGRDPSRDSILHIACKRYSEDSSPQINDWIVNPGETIKKRVWMRLYKRTGISTKQAKDAPLWDEIRDKVLSFLEDIDVIFVRNSDIAAEWFEGIVYRDITAPTLVDLNEMYQFFLPEKSVPYSDIELINLGKSMRVSEGDHKLYKVLSGMIGILDRILKVVLSREEINTKTYHPVYSLFAWALSVDENQSSFHALYKVASVANRIEWSEGQILGLSFDIPDKIEVDNLIQFIKDWTPSNLIKADRESFDKSFMGTEIQSLYEKDKSTNLLLHVLRLILEHTDAKSDVMEYISYKMAKMQTQVQRMQGYIFEIVRRLYAIENFIQDWENKRDRYNNIYEELVEWYLKLEKCLDEIKENLKILSKIRLPQTLTVSFNSELIHLIFSWFNEAVKRSGEFIKLLQDSPNQLPEPDKSYPIRTLSSSERNSVALLFQQLSKLKAEYLTNTKPTQKEFREPDFKTLFSNSEYEPRDEQEQYAWFIREAINVSGVYAIEAGTGTGKTLGYLSPVCEHIRLNKDRQVIVATSTINLMDQIIAKEWPILVSKRDFLYHDLQIAILAGKRNYLCTSALKRFFHTLNPIENEQDISQKNGTLIHSDDRLAWLYLFQILTRKNGQWDSIDNFSKKYPRIAKEFEIDLDAENACKPNLCRMGQNCSFPQAVRRAQFAHVLITNHHKLVKLEAEIQKRASVCIIDEADQFPDNLRSALSESLSKKDVMNFIRRVGGGTKNRRGFVQILHDGLEETQSKCESALESLSKIEESCHQIGKCLFNSTKSASNIKEKRWKNLSPNHQSILSQVLKNIAEQFCIIGHELTQIFKSNPEIFGVTKNEEKTEFFDRMNRYIYDAEEFRAVTKSLMSAIGSNEFIVTYNQKSYDWTITKTPFSIRNDVKRVTGSFETAVLTSATLYVDETLNLLLTELLDDEASKDLFVAEKKILSPFNYDRQVRGAVAPFIKGYDYSDDHNGFNKKWEDQILAAIALQSLVLDGRTLVLFTSWGEMQKMHKRIAPVFQEFGIPLLLQDRVGSSEAIIQEFAGLEESVLFGTGRFWTGVDFPGPTLTQLMIVRLPNRAWNSSLVAERRERWTEEKFNLWYTQNTRRKLR